MIAAWIIALARNRSRLASCWGRSPSSRGRSLSAAVALCLSRPAAALMNLTEYAESPPREVKAHGLKTIFDERF